ncbi:MAG: aminotransferase class V-fold PLP-dependent enzyme [Alphaproteobacteria bacterium]|nr:aminotransferase class V-fold PLP-dependent enzyme [Alphaproteobacteria bacterium]
MKFYLDNNAHVPILPEARLAMMTMLGQSANPSSPHQQGQKLRQVLESARHQVRVSLNAGQGAVIFTSSGSEANNICLNLWNHPLIISAIEHPSVLQPAVAQGGQVIRVGQEGRVDLNHLDSLLAETTRPALVSLMLANNETGVIQPVGEAAQLVHRYDGYLHCDASQALARQPVDFTALAVDFMTISGQKIGGGLGAAALVMRAGLTEGALGQAMTPLMRGGDQESGLRPSTENVPAIAGFAAALRNLPRHYAAMPEIAAWRNEIIALCRRLYPNAVVVGDCAPRLANTLCIALPPVPSAVTIMACDLAGVSISAGSACSSGSMGKSKILQAMNLPDAIINSAVRLSLGLCNLPLDQADTPTARAALMAKLESVLVKSAENPRTD